MAEDQTNTMVAAELVIVRVPTKESSSRLPNSKFSPFTSVAFQKAATCMDSIDMLGELSAIREFCTTPWTLYLFRQSVHLRSEQRYNL